MTTGDLYILAIVVALVVLSVYSIIRDRRSGKGSCSCGCKSCSGGCCESAPVIQITDEKKN